jgi:hypothetical protein
MNKFGPQHPSHKMPIQEGTTNGFTVPCDCGNILGNVHWVVIPIDSTVDF